MNRWLEKLADNYPDLKACLPDVQKAFEILQAAYRHGGKVLICGNGGSAADAEHLVGELMKGYLSTRPVPEALRQKLALLFTDQGKYLADHLQGALASLSLVSQVGLITAYANDVAADMIFAQQVYGYGRVGDVVVGISTSGNSTNVVHALQVGRALDLHAIGFTGQSGGAMKAICEVAVCVARQRTSDVQERHLAIYHALCAMLEEDFFPAAA